LPLNRDGAAGWVADDAVWFVSKRLADEVRRFMQAHGDHAVPGNDKNDRLFDVWQEYGALVPNPVTGGAVWRARVEGPDYAHELTLLRFPLTRLWPDAARFPPAMQGSIVILPTPDTASDPRGGEREPESESKTANDATKIESPLHALRIESVSGDPTADLTTSEACPPIARSSLQPVSPAIGPLPRLHQGPVRRPSTLALEFMAWLQSGVADGSMLYNESGALVHFVAEGLFLVSPGVFRDYARTHPAARNTERSAPKDWPGKAVQKAVCGAGWNRKGPRNKSVLTYQVVSRKGASGKTLNGVVVLQPERFFDPVPPANPHLQRLPQDSGNRTQ
jgi:hypothetical protein